MNPKIKEILSDAFAAASIIIGFSLHGWPSLCFLVLGSICGAFALYHTLLNHRIHNINRPKARNWALLLLALSLLGVIAYRREDKQPIPQPIPQANVAVALSMPDPQNPFLLLTNDNFFTTNSVVPISNMLGCVIVPLPADFTNVLMPFLIANYSYTPADLIECELSIPSETPFVPGPEWQRAAPLYKGSSTFFFKLPSSILRFEAEPLPNTTFILKSGEITVAHLIFTIRGKNTPDTFWSFWMAFKPVAKPSNPHIGKVELFSAGGTNFIKIDE